MEGGFRNMALNALFPRFCLSCKREGQIFCFGCMENWVVRPEPATCPFCEEKGSNRTCVKCRETNFLDGLVSYLPYGNPIVRGAIGCWKYDGDRSVEPIIKQWLIQSSDRLRPSIEEFVVSSVPVHTSRKRMRGFDQAAILSNWVAEMYAMLDETLIVRSKKTKPQAQKQHDQRQIGSLDGIFEIRPGLVEIPRRVLLCDDVFTSGATMDAAARCLKEVGVEEVWGFVIGRG
jgi:ComF family protein